MIQIIINADDLGKSHEVNVAIAEAFDKKHISSSTILANSQTWDEIHQIVTCNPQASFGIHLNLTEGRAMTNSAILKKYEIVDENNCFTKKSKTIEIVPEELKNAIFNEWDAQLRKVIIEEKIRISHIDGHHHIHARSQYLEILLEILKKYDITKVRNRYETTYSTPRTILNQLITFLAVIPGIYGYIARARTNNSIIQYIQTLLENNKWRSRVSKVASITDYFNSYESQIILCKSGKIIPQGKTIELMCHPGHLDYSHEYKLIEQNTISKYVDNLNFINYTDIQ